MPLHPDLRRTVARAAKTGAPVRIYRDECEEPGECLVGQIQTYTDRTLLLRDISDRAFVYEGYNRIDTADITRVQTQFPELSLMKASMNLARTPPPFPTDDLDDLRLFLPILQRHYPLITFFQERLRREACYIGKLIRVYNDSCSVQTVGTNGRWSGVSVYKLDDITQVYTGGCYENALERALRNAARKKQ